MKRAIEILIIANIVATLAVAAEVLSFDILAKRNFASRENIMRQTIEALTMQNARLRKSATIGRIALETMPIDERDGINVPVRRCVR